MQHQQQQQQRRAGGRFDAEDRAKLTGGLEDLRAPFLEIPLRSQDERRVEMDESIVFDPFDLPPVDSVIEVLIDQEADQKRWLRFAAAYFRQNRATSAERLLMTVRGEYQLYRSGGSNASGSRFNPDRVYQHDMEGRCLVGNSLAWLYIYYAKEHRLTRLHAGGGGGVSAAAALANFEKKPISILNPDLVTTSEVLVPQLLAKAESLLNQAEKFSRAETVASVTWINRAELVQEQVNYKLATMKQFSQSDMDRALSVMDKNYATSIEYRRLGMRAMFGRANIHFQRGQFKEAKDMYIRAIQEFPGADPGPTRVALGLCFYELGQEGRAQECFERALELDPKSVDAQVCLAILENGLASEAERKPGSTARELAENQLEAKRLRERASDRLRLAYEVDKLNPLLQVHLANNFFFSSDAGGERDYKRVGDLAKEAFNHTSQKKIQAEASYISARNFHAQGDMRTAATLYSKCLDCWPSFPLARYGHAQMELTQAKPDLSAALRAVEQVVEVMEDDEDCLLMIGSLHAKMHNNDAALQALRRVTEKNPHRVEAWMSQALIEQSKYRQNVGSAEEAIRCYDKAVAALKFHKQPVPYELHNNVAALRFRVGDFEGALAAFDLAIKMRNPTSAADTVTLFYNRARALEGLGRFGEAEDTYANLIASVAPEVHYDSHMRLAAICAARGDYATALDVHLKPLLKTASSSSGGGNADFLCFYASLELESSTSPFVQASAEAKLKKILETSKHDAYARLLLANQTFAVAQSADKDANGALSTALGVYRTVLKMNPANMFAANGIGASQALRGRFEAAKLILDKVREFADKSCPSVWINLAHVYMHEESYSQAASLYDQCLRRFYEGRDAELSLYLANALFSAQKHQEARLVLLAALRHFPHDDALWFGTAAVDEAEAHERLALDPKLRTVAMVEQAKRALERALAVYSWIATSKQEQATAQPPSIELVAKQEFAASQALGGVPHRPRPPMGPRQQGAACSAALLSTARVALAELEGRTPDQADLEEMRRAATERNADEDKAAEQYRVQGRRADRERALPNVSSKLAFYAAKRIEYMKQEVARSAQYLAVQIRFQAKETEERKQLEQQQQQELEARRERERVRAEQIQREDLERQVKAKRLAEQNAEMARVWQEEEGEEAGKARKSTRARKKSKKMREAEEARKVQRFSDEEEEENSSSSSSSSEEEEVAGQFQAPEPINTEETEVAQECDKLFSEKQEEQSGGGETEEVGVSWYKQELKRRLGEDVLKALRPKFIQDHILYLTERKARADKMSARVMEEEESSSPRTTPTSKRAKIVQSDSEEEEDGEQQQPAAAAEEVEDEF